MADNFRTYGFDTVSREAGTPDDAAIPILELDPIFHLEGVLD